MVLKKNILKNGREENSSKKNKSRKELKRYSRGYKAEIETNRGKKALVKVSEEKEEATSKR